MSGLFVRVISALRRRFGTRAEIHTAARHRGPTDHIVLLDGTMGSLRHDRITSIGLIYRYLRGHVPMASIYYGRGLRWREWHEFSDVWFGWGVNRQILRAYGWLAMRYRPGDRIFLIGYSRGAFAARSLAGMIERVGLLRSEHAIERNTQLAWRHYEGETPAPVLGAFQSGLCHPEVPIEFVGAFDTVSALGLPFLRDPSHRRVRFHDHRLGRSVRHACHALALDETRKILAPLLWESEGNPGARIEQVWFRGCHGDIGGHLGHFGDARPLANIPLVWMLERMASRGVALPEGWRDEFPCDPAAPSIGSWRGWGRWSWLRAARAVGQDPSERLHDTVPVPARRGWWPRRAMVSDLGVHDETGGGAGGIQPPVSRTPDLAPRDPG